MFSVSTITAHARFLPSAQYAIPETLVHAVLTICFLLSGEYAACLVNLPLLCYHAYRWSTNTHLHFATDAIRTMDKRKQESNVRFGFYLTCLFYYAYRYVRIYFLLSHRWLS